MRGWLIVGLVACGNSKLTPDATQHGDGSSDSSHDASGTGSDASSTSWWQPGTGSLPWQWELDHTIVTTNTADMGTGDKTYSNADASDPIVYDIDGFDNDAAQVTALHGLGKHVVCYIEVGGAENDRPDYSQFPAAALGKIMPGYPSEKYIDITNATVMTIIKARIAMCAQKGFDAIEPDIDDSYTDDTGFTITEATNAAYLAALSDYAHSLGLAWGLKNGADGGTPAKFIADLIPHIDFAVVEEPFFLDTIGSFSPALYTAGKAMFVAEYTNDTASASSFCSEALADHTNAALFDVALDAATRVPCE